MQGRAVGKLVWQVAALGLQFLKICRDDQRFIVVPRTRDFGNGLYITSNKYVICWGNRGLTFHALQYEKLLNIIRKLEEAMAAGVTPWLFFSGAIARFFEQSIAQNKQQPEYGLP